MLLLVSYSILLLFYMVGSLLRDTGLLAFDGIVFAVGLILPTTASAQTGVSISPAIIEPGENIEPGSEHHYSIEVENLLDTEQEFYVFVRNISDVGSAGTPVFAESNDEVTGMEVADWIELPFESIVIQGNESADVNFTMRVPEDASPGSHFGGVFFSVDAPEIEKSGAAIGYQVANIISLRIAGDVIESARIRQFSTDKFFYGSLDVDFNVRIENTGNVLVKPFGPIEIRNMLGQEVDVFTFNEDLSRIIPSKTREFKENWQGTGVGFGRYEVSLSAVYGNEGAIQTMYNTTSFWVLPMQIIGPALAILATILLIVFVVVRVYINRTVAQLSGGTTRVIKRRRRHGPSPALLLTVVMLTVISLFLIVLLVLFA